MGITECQLNYHAVEEKYKKKLMYNKKEMSGKKRTK